MQVRLIIIHDVYVILFTLRLIIRLIIKAIYRAQTRKEESTVVCTVKFSSDEKNI